VTSIGRRALAVLLLLTAGCPPDEIKLRAVDSEKPGDYGRRELLEAGAVMRRTPTSPEAFGVLYRRVEELRPSFTDETVELSERTLAFSAVPVMDAVASRPVKEQAEVLALTVWAAAFSVVPLENETSEQFVQRMCGVVLVRECGDVVPGYWTLVLSHLAWKRFGERARAAFAHCPECRADPEFIAALDKLAVRADQLRVRVARQQDAFVFSAWPIAGPRSQPWSGAPLFQRTPPNTYFAGAPIQGGTWSDTLRTGRGSHTALGIYVRPGDRVEIVRKIAAVAVEAGFTEIALMARDRVFPYERREYRLAVGKRAKGTRVRIRDLETVQGLVEAADATMALADRLELELTEHR
jgi:hypothetical protein